MSWEMETIVNATVSVDTFFLMSGLLVSYLLLRELDRSGGKFNVALFYLHRYLRYNHSDLIKYILRFR
jgi:peptidoglycan/LPS O-acetylase OafA/YrhL